MIQPIGGVKLIKESVDQLESVEIEDLDKEEGMWIFQNNDWVNVYTGELLTGYEPTRKDLSIRKKIRNLQETG